MSVQKDQPMFLDVSEIAEPFFRQLIHATNARIIPTIKAQHQAHRSFANKISRRIKLSASSDWGASARAQKEVKFAKYALTYSLFGPDSSRHAEDFVQLRVSRERLAGFEAAFSDRLGDGRKLSLRALVETSHFVGIDAPKSMMNDLGRSHPVAMLGAQIAAYTTLRAAFFAAGSLGAGALSEAVQFELDMPFSPVDVADGYNDEVLPDGDRGGSAGIEQLLAPQAAVATINSARQSRRQLKQDLFLMQKAAVVPPIYPVHEFGYVDQVTPIAIVHKDGEIDEIWAYKKSTVGLHMLDIGNADLLHSKLNGGDNGDWLMHLAWSFGQRHPGRYVRESQSFTECTRKGLEPFAMLPPFAPNRGAFSLVSK